MVTAAIPVDMEVIPAEAMVEAAEMEAAVAEGVAAAAVVAAEDRLLRLRSVSRLKFPRKMRLDRRPLAGNDAVDTSIARGPVG